MKPTLRDMYGALPNTKVTVNTLNCWGIVTLAVMFLSGCIVLCAVLRVIEALS